ncbi:hypothetical protein EVJ58_g9543 [Rhodofomes roseus]|uniref:Uncharacterized protein n=1 Tax=Rhodofomes roseus TaxID=34475 RepID=A0A4Y9XXF1_9APHY|nr:hypothetical protein EVJ58_g9543 [Rhodofomes roseus]
MPAELHAALKHQKQEAKSRRDEKRRIVADLGLQQKSNESRLAALEASATLYFLKQLSDEDCYPPRGFFMCKTRKSQAGWTKWVYERKLPDSLLVRRTMRLEVRCKLKLIVPKDKNVIIRDKELGKIVLIVRRNLCSDAEILADTNNTVIFDCSLKRNIRLEDLGKLVLAGYSAGSRSSPVFDYVCNIKAKKLSEEFVRSHHMAVSSRFSLFHQLMRGVLPDEVLQDYEKWIEENGFPRMDAQGAIPVDEDGRGEFYVEKGGKMITLLNFNCFGCYHMG